MIFRTVMEEIIVGTDTEKKLLQFTIHWKIIRINWLFSRTGRN